MGGASAKKLPTWLLTTTLGHGYVSCCHIGQSHFWQIPLEAGERRGGDEVGYKGREEGGKEAMQSNLSTTEVGMLLEEHGGLRD